MKSVEIYRNGDVWVNRNFAIRIDGDGRSYRLGKSSGLDSAIRACDRLARYPENSLEAGKKYEIERMVGAAERLALMKCPESAIEISSYFEELWFSEYAEGQGYPEGEIAAFGNWNGPGGGSGGREAWKVVMPLLCDHLERFGIQTEWIDEWSPCSDCGLALRVNPDSHDWEPAFQLNDGEILCQNCQETIDTES